MIINQTEEQQLLEWLGHFETAILTTRDAEGQLKGRLMTLPQFRDEDCPLWFPTEASSQKVAEIHNDTNVSVSCYCSGSRRWLSVSGHARLLPLEDSLREGSWGIWASPGSRLIRILVEPVEATYWEPDRLGTAKALIQTLLFGIPTEKVADSTIHFESGEIGEEGVGPEKSGLYSLRAEAPISRELRPSSFKHRGVTSTNRVRSGRGKSASTPPMIRGERESSLCKLP